MQVLDNSPVVHRMVFKTGLNLAFCYSHIITAMKRSKMTDDNYWGTNLTAFGANIAFFRSNKISQIPDQINLNFDQKYPKNVTKNSSQFCDQISTDLSSKIH